MSDQLSQFQNMAPEPKLWDNIDNEIKDERVYDSEGTKAMQEWFMAQFYWAKKELANPVIQVEENVKEIQKSIIESEEILDDSKNYEEANTINENQEKQNEIVLEKFKDNPGYPILERFMNIEVWEWKKMDLLTENDLLKLSNTIHSWDNLLESLKEWIKDIEFDNEKTSYVLNNYINTIEWINDTKEVDSEWLYNLPDDFKSYPVLFENLDDTTVQLLIKNYTIFPDGENWEPNITKDIDTAFELTLNNIINNKNFPQTDVYKQAVNEVRTWDIDSRLEALQYINSMVNTQEWVKWGKAWNSFKKITKEYSLAKDKYLDYKKLQLAEMITNWEDIKLIENKQNEIDIIDKNYDNTDIKQGEAIFWGKDDVLNDKVSENPTENK
jgi:hypothetical protein